MCDDFVKSIHQKRVDNSHKIALVKALQVSSEGEYVCIVEGAEDRRYYQFHLNQLSRYLQLDGIGRKITFNFFIAKTKDKCLESQHFIRVVEGLHSTLCFVDADFNKDSCLGYFSPAEAVDNGVYISDGYSVENSCCNKDTLESMLNTVFGFNDIDSGNYGRSIEILQHYELMYDGMLTLLSPYFVLLYALVNYGERVDDEYKKVLKTYNDKPEDMIKFRNGKVALSNGYLNDVVGSRYFTGIYDNFKHEFKIWSTRRSGENLTYGKVQLRVFASYVCWVKSCLDSGKPSGRNILRLKKTTIQNVNFTSSGDINQFIQYSNCPSSLKIFFERNILTPR